MITDKRDEKEKPQEIHQMKVTQMFAHTIACPKCPVKLIKLVCPVKSLSNHVMASATTHITTMEPAPRRRSSPSNVA